MLYFFLPFNTSCVNSINQKTFRTCNVTSTETSLTMRLTYILQLQSLVNNTITTLSIITGLEPVSWRTTCNQRSNSHSDNTRSHSPAQQSQWLNVRDIRGTSSSSQHRQTKVSVRRIADGDIEDLVIITQQHTAFVRKAVE